jgi:1-phosphofructokinase family hexose kinase
VSLLCVALSPSVDVTYVVAALRPGRTHRPTTAVHVPGGKGFNAARAAAALGSDVAAAGIVGGGSGRWIAAELAGAGIAADLVDGGATTRTCMSVLDGCTGELTEVYEPASPVTADEWERLAAAVACRAPRAAWVTLSGSLPAGAPDDAVATLAGAAAGVPVVLDTHGTALAAGIGHADVVKVNAAEAAALLGEPPSTGPAVLATGLLDVAARPRLAVVTIGAGGAVAAARDAGPVHARPAAHPAGAFAVGSGDAFLAGLAGALAEGRGVPDALRRAVAAGWANALVPGAARLDPAVAAELAGRVTISP